MDSTIVFWFTLSQTIQAMETGAKKQFINIGDLIQRLRQQDSIPALDENVMALSRLTNEQKSSAAELTSVIMRDAALTSRLLAVANSATYRPVNPVRTVSSAVVLFGFTRIHQLAVGLSIFHKHTGEARDKELYRLLVCAYCSGNLALQLANAIGDAEPEEFFIAGLMRQLPRLVLANGYPALYAKMESLVSEKNYNIESASEEVFGIRFSEITKAIAEYWHLDDNMSHFSPSSGKNGEKRRVAVQLAVDVSDLLFGNRPTGPKAVGAVTEAIQKFLRKPDLSLPDFVGKAAHADPNIADFFNLSSEDMVMMTRIAEWGKVSSSDVANSLTNTREKQPPQPPASDSPPLMMAHFLSELTLAIRDQYSFSDILMIAQEGVFRCIPCECVVILFVDRGRRFVQGRLYAGRKSGILANRCRVTLKPARVLAAQNLEGRDPEIIEIGPGVKVLDNDSLLRELQIHQVLMAPVQAGGQPIGQFLLCRKSDEPPFSADDQLWMSAITSHIGMSFAQG